MASKVITTPLFSSRQQIQELEATLYNALQQDKVLSYYSHIIIIIILKNDYKFTFEMHSCDHANPSNPEHLHCLHRLLGQNRSSGILFQEISTDRKFVYIRTRRYEILPWGLRNDSCYLLCLVPVSFLQVIKYGEPLDELQKDELRTAVEKLRRQMLRKSREYDCQILQERMELLHQAHQVRPCLWMWL